MKIKDIVVKEGIGKITAMTPDGSVEITDQSGIKTTLPKDKVAALMPDASAPNKFALNPQAVAPAGPDAAGKPAGPQVGAEVEIKASEDQVSREKTDDLIQDVEVQELFGFGNKSPEEWAQTSQQMAKLLQLQKAYQNTPYQAQIEKRIKLLKDRLDLDQGEPTGPDGQPKAVVPPEQFKDKIEEEPVAYQESAELEEMLRIAGLR